MRLLPQNHMMQHSKHNSKLTTRVSRPVRTGNGLYAPWACFLHNQPAQPGRNFRWNVVIKSRNWLPSVEINCADTFYSTH